MANNAEKLWQCLGCGQTFRTDSAIKSHIHRRRVQGCQQHQAALLKRGIGSQHDSHSQLPGVPSQEKDDAAQNKIDDSGGLVDDNKAEQVQGQIRPFPDKLILSGLLCNQPFEPAEARAPHANH